MSGTGAFSASCVTNPDFCNATHVFVPYCTGDCVSQVWQRGTLVSAFPDMKYDK